MAALIPVAGIIGIVIGYFLNQRIERRKRQLDVAKELQEGIDQVRSAVTSYWVYYIYNQGKALDAVDLFARLGVWRPRLRDASLRNRLDVAENEADEFMRLMWKGELQKESRYKYVLDQLEMLSQELGAYWH